MVYKTHKLPTIFTLFTKRHRRKKKKQNREMAALSPPAPLMEFSHDSSSCSTPYISAPSSPKLITRDLYFSAPTSPTCFTSIYQEFHKNPSINGVSNSMIPFGWEEKPGTPKHKLKPTEEDEDDDEFAFDFNAQFEKSSALSAADELFYGGKIRPLKPPPGIKIGFHDDRRTLVFSPRSPISQGKKIIRDAFSPRKRNRDIDPFAVAIEESRKQQEQEHEEQRGRNEKRMAGSNSKKTSSHRSLSPLRASDKFDEKQEPKVPTHSSSKWYSFGGYKKWKLRDLLLFRSASEGRANDKDTIRKFAVLTKKEDVKSSSFRSTDSTGSTSSSRRRGGGPAVSAHELHYTMNRANSEELKRKTVLPYRTGFFGGLGFNPTANGSAKGFNL